LSRLSSIRRTRAWFIVVALLAQRAWAAEQSDQAFDIAEFRVLGNTVLPARVVEAAVYPYLGNAKTLQTVQQAREALTAAYRNAGYGTVFIDIPEQSVDEGIVRLKVSEGRVQKVRVAGAKYYSERRIRDELPSLRQGEVPKLPELQSDLATLSAEARDRQITPLLKPGTEPGTVAVDLSVKDRVPFHASLQADDRYTPDTAHARLTGILSYDNLFQHNESLSLQYETSPQRTSQVKLWALTYSGHTALPSLTWSAYAIRSNSDVAALGTLGVLGNGKIFGARLTNSWYPSGTVTNALSFGADYKDFGQTVQATTGTSESPIHYLLWTSQYSLSVQRERFDTAASIGLSFALRQLAGNDAEFDFNRYAAQANFIYLRGNGAFTYRVWHDAAVNLRYAFQYAPAPLVNNEQFAVGGAESVRGYIEAETLDDMGVTAGLELRAPPLVVGPARLVGYVFADGGLAGIQQPLPEQTSRVTLYSTGVGFRGSPYTGLDLALDLAEPLRNGPRTRRDDKRVDFLVKYAY